MMRLVLEDMLRPPEPADPWSRDVLSVALLLILAAVLIPAWDIGPANFQHTVVGNMASFLLLPTLGFLLALRCGAIDLSVWVNAGLGGVVAAVLIARGVSAPLAFAAGGGVGLAAGCLNGLLVAGAGIPSVAATLAVAAGTVWALGAVLPARSVAIPDLTFEGWLAGHPSPMLAARVLTVAVLYLGALALVMVLDVAVWRGVQFGRRVSVFAALAASGALSALGGACWLIDSGRAPVPTRVVDDLRVPAAAVLAGALFLGRRGREVLAAMSLPAALLLATIWRQEAWSLPAPGHGYALQLLVLAGMTVVVHIAFGHYVDSRPSPDRWPAAGALMTLAGLALVAAAANFTHPAVKDAFHAAGVAAWLSGTAAVLITMRRKSLLHVAPVEADAGEQGEEGETPPRAE
jgi:ribose/xylose/arabinose/galactoside ABC-type transport system permease subunit